MAFQAAGKSARSIAKVRTVSFSLGCVLSVNWFCVCMSVCLSVSMSVSLFVSMCCACVCVCVCALYVMRRHSVNKQVLLPPRQLRPYRYGGHKGPVHDVAVSADGTRIASASADRTVRLWKNTSKVSRGGVCVRVCVRVCVCVWERLHLRASVCV